MGDKIEPCPWCKGCRQSVRDTGVWRRFSVACWTEGCYAEGPRRYTEDAAIAAWNEVAGLRAEVERLKAEAEERNDRDWSRSR